MAFNFGAPTSSGASSGSLFGTTGNTTGGSGGTGGGLFGGGNNTGSTGFSFTGFGQPPASSGGETQKPLFGTVTDKSPTGGLFGQPSTGNTTSSSNPTFSFGKKPEEASSGNNTSSSPFAAFGTPGKPATTGTTPAPSLFGSTTPAASSSTGGFSFGNPSTTPAGPPPSTTAFSASTGGAGLFGQPKQTQDNSKPAATFSFGKPADPPAASAPSATSSASTGGLFGSAQPGPTTGGLFGSKPAGTGGFNFGPPPKPAEKTADTPAPASSAPAGQKPLFNFGQPPASTTTNTTTSGSTPSLFAPTTTTSSSSAPSLFSPAPATTQTASSQPTPSLFGAAPTTTQQNAPSLFSKPTAPTTADSAPKPSFSFPTTTPQSAPTSASTTTSTTTKPLFGAAPATTPASATTPSLFGAPASSATTTAPTLTSTAALAGEKAPTSTAFRFGDTDSTSKVSTSGPVPPAQSRLRNKTMDEILTRWATDLTRYTKDFKNNAETVAKWDQIIVDNSSKIDKLYVRTRTCEKQTMSVEMQLAAVENQQAELESWLTKYENDVDEMLARDGTNPSELGGPDQERERTYKLAERLGEKLDDMGRDLESMVEEVNAANASLSKNGKADEPITQIVKILNSHLTQLQAIDQGTVVLQSKVAAAQKAARGLGFQNGQGNGDGRAAVDDFYRSYMGRR